MFQNVAFAVVVQKKNPLSLSEVIGAIGIYKKTAA